MRVRLARRIEVPAGAHAVGRAAVTLFVNVEAVLPRREPGDAARHTDLATLLLEADGTRRGVACRRLERRLGSGPAARARGTAGKYKQGGDDGSTQNAFLHLILLKGG